MVVWGRGRVMLNRGERGLGGGKRDGGGQGRVINRTVSFYIDRIITVHPPYFRVRAMRNDDDSRRGPEMVARGRTGHWPLQVWTDKADCR